MDHTMREHFAHFARNERWGTCVDCPRTPADNHAHPEFCENTDRYDHRLTFDELADYYRRYKGI